MTDTINDWKTFTEFLEGGFQRVTLSADLDTLLAINGTEGMNQYLENYLEDIGHPHFPTDISYDIVGTEGQQILIHATFMPSGKDDEDAAAGG